MNPKMILNLRISKWIPVGEIHSSVCWNIPVVFFRPSNRLKSFFLKQYQVASTTFQKGIFYCQDNVFQYYMLLYSLYSFKYFKMGLLYNILMQNFQYFS